MDNQLKTACYFLAAGGIGIALTMICATLGLAAYMGALYQLTLVGAAVLLGIGAYLWRQWRDEAKLTRQNQRALKG